MLRYNYKTPMGKMIIEQPVADKMKRFTITICEANCMAAFVSISKKTDGKELHTLYSFFGDAQHANNIAKNNDGKLFWDKVVSIELNMAFKEAMPLLKILVKNGYKVKCYYKAIKED